MRTPNPFANDAPTDLEDRALVERARAGERDALRDSSAIIRDGSTILPFAWFFIRKTPRTRRRKSSSRH